MLSFKQFITEAWWDVSYGHDLKKTGPESGFVKIQKSGDSNFGKLGRVVRRMGADCGVELWVNGKPVPGMHWYHAAELKPTDLGRKFGAGGKPATPTAYGAGARPIPAK